MNPTGSLTNSKTAVKKLKNKRLTDFINDVAATIPDPVHFHSASNTSVDLPKPNHSPLVRYKPFSVVDLEREQILKQYQIGEDEPPLLYVGRRTLKLRKDSTQLKEIVNSYMTFKELSIEAEEECPEFA